MCCDLFLSRVGWSVEEAGLGLGEVPFSYGYGGTGKAVVNNRYNEYGESYGPGDVIGCFVVSGQLLTGSCALHIAYF